MCWAPRVVIFPNAASVALRGFGIQCAQVHNMPSIANDVIPPLGLSPGSAVKCYLSQCWIRTERPESMPPAFCKTLGLCRITTTSATSPCSHVEGRHREGFQEPWRSTASLLCSWEALGQRTKTGIGINSLCLNLPILRIGGGGEISLFPRDLGVLNQRKRNKSSFKGWNSPDCQTGKKKTTIWFQLIKKMLVYLHFWLWQKGVYPIHHPMENK